MRQVNDIVLSGLSDASTNGEQIDTNQMLSMSFHLVSDVAVSGTFKLQASNDVAPLQISGPTFIVTNWIDIPNQSNTLASATQSILVLSANDTPFRWVRAVFTHSGGGDTGTLIVQRFGQGV